MQELNELREPVLGDYLRLLTAAAIWGSTFLNNEIALLDFSPSAISAYRILGAAVLLLMICYWRGTRLLLERRTLFLLLCIAILNSVLPFTLISLGQMSVDSSTTGILLATSPFATLLMSHYLTSDDRFSWSKACGLMLGFVGVCALLGQGFEQGTDSVTGMLLIMVAGCCYALSSILIRRLGSVSSIALAASSLLLGSLIMLPALLVLDPPWQQDYRASSVAALLFLAVGPTAFCYFLRAQIVKINGAVFMSNVGYLIPLFAVLWGWLFLGNSPSGTMVLALLLIFSGIAVGQQKFHRRPSR